VRRTLIRKFKDQLQGVWFIGYLNLILTLMVIPIMLRLMKLIFGVVASNIIGFENDNVVNVSYNLSMFVTLLYNCYEY
jgi:hypothetical protein